MSKVVYILPIVGYNIAVAKTKYYSVKQIAELWGISERSVRNYCAEGRVPGAIQSGLTWQIPINTEKPPRKIRHTESKSDLLTVLKREKDAGLKGGIYHKIQIDLTYNSNHIEGSRLSHEQTRFIFETKTIGATNEVLNVDDIVETFNHFRCVDLVIEGARTKLTESFIKQLHFILKSGTSDSQKTWFRVGEYKLVENEVGGTETTPPENVKAEMRKLISTYNSLTNATLDDILDFHVRFEKIHPFQDGNGRVGRLIMFKECLKNDIVPFIITDELKMFYYSGIRNWQYERGYLRDTCLMAEDTMKKWLEHFINP